MEMSHPSGWLILYSGKFVVFELQTVADVYTKGQQGNGNLGNHTGIVILDVGIISANICYGTEHNDLL